MTKYMTMAVPVFIWLLAGLLVMKAGDLPPAAEGPLAFSAYPIFTVGILLSWWFNRSRVLFILAMLGITQMALTSGSSQETASLLYAFASVLLPVNIFLFSLFKERGIVSKWGLVKVALLLVQSLLVTVVLVTRDLTLTALFQAKFLPAWISDLTPLPHIALFIFVLVFLFLLKRRNERAAYLDHAFAGVLLAIFAALHEQSHAAALPVFFAAAGVMLACAVMQESYSMAYLDELTGLPARRALKEEMLKLSGVYTIAMLDIDCFKEFNDTYGHATGDEVLRLVASVLKESKGGGKAFRYGGEEFTMVFAGRTAQESIVWLDELRTAVENTSYTYQGKSGRKNTKAKLLSVTISIGFAEKKEKLSDAEEVIKAADAALYRAKNKGRNCVSA